MKNVCYLKIQSEFLFGCWMLLFVKVNTSISRLKTESTPTNPSNWKSTQHRRSFHLGKFKYNVNVFFFWFSSMFVEIYNLFICFLPSKKKIIWKIKIHLIFKYCLHKFTCLLFEQRYFNHIAQFDARIFPLFFEKKKKRELFDRQTKKIRSWYTHLHVCIIAQLSLVSCQQEVLS